MFFVVGTVIVLIAIVAIFVGIVMIVGVIFVVIAPIGISYCCCYYRVFHWFHFYPFSSFYYYHCYYYYLLLFGPTGAFLLNKGMSGTGIEQQTENIGQDKIITGVKDARLPSICSS